MLLAASMMVISSYMQHNVAAWQPAAKCYSDHPNHRQTKEDCYTTWQYDTSCTEQGRTTVCNCDGTESVTEGKVYFEVIICKQIYRKIEIITNF